VMWMAALAWAGWSVWKARNARAETAAAMGIAD
jgi:hypothetical protein